MGDRLMVHACVPLCMLEFVRVRAPQVDDASTRACIPAYASVYAPHSPQVDSACVRAHQVDEACTRVACVSV